MAARALSLLAARRSQLPLCACLRIIPAVSTSPSALPRLSSTTLASYSTTTASADPSTVSNRSSSDNALTAALSHTSSLSPEATAASDSVEKEHPIITQFINNIMQDGKKSIASRIMVDALQLIQTELRQDPRLVVAAAVERASPYIKVMSAKRGARNVQMPLPLTDHQRFRAGIIAIRDAALNGKSPRTAGERLGREIIAVINGSSNALQRREQIHKLALANRSNVILTDRKINRAF